MSEKKLPPVPAGPLEITVRLSAGAYNTQRVAGRSASSTMDARCAAERLADKLWGLGLAELLRDVSPGVSVWRIRANAALQRP